jgi:CRISPR-associated protein Csx3
MSSFNIEFDASQNLLTTSFGEPATNAQIVQDVRSRLTEIKASGGLAGGSLLKINGPISLPAAFTVGHGVFHAYGAIAVFDPKLQAYIVAVTHNPDYKLGELID